MSKQLLIAKVDENRIIFTNAMTGEVLLKCTKEFLEDLFDATESNKGVAFIYDKESANMNSINL